MGGGIFSVLKKKEAKNAWHRNLKMKWFSGTPLFATTAPPPRAWTEGWNSGVFSDNCGWLEVILSGTFTNVLVCSHHSQWLLKHRLSSSWWCVILTLDAGRQARQWQKPREREDGPAQALEQTASQNAGDYRSLTVAHNPKKYIPSYSAREVFRREAF